MSAAIGFKISNDHSTCSASLEVNFLSDRGPTCFPFTPMVAEYLRGCSAHTRSLYVCNRVIGSKADHEYKAEFANVCISFVNAIRIA